MSIAALFCLLVVGGFVLLAVGAAVHAVVDATGSITVAVAAWAIVSFVMLLVFAAIENWVKALLPL